MHLHATLNRVCGVPLLPKYSGCSWATCPTAPWPLLLGLPGDKTTPHSMKNLACLTLCFVSVCFFCGKNGPWLEYGRIFSIKKILMQLDLLSSMVVDVTPLKSYLYTSTTCCSVNCQRTIFEASFDSPPENEQRQTPGWPMASTVGIFIIPTGESRWKRFDVNNSLEFLMLFTLNRLQISMSKLLKHVHTTSENPQLWDFSHIGSSQNLTFTDLLQYFVWGFQVNQEKNPLTSPHPEAPFSNFLGSQWPEKIGPWQHLPNVHHQSPSTTLWRTMARRVQMAWHWNRWQDVKELQT